MGAPQPEPGEPLWTADDRDVAVGLLTYRAELCGSCGMPREVCHDPDAVYQWRGEVRHCHVTAAQQRAMRKHKAQQSPDVDVDLDGAYSVALRLG